MTSGDGGEGVQNQPDKYILFHTYHTLSIN